MTTTVGRSVALVANAVITQRRCAASLLRYPSVGPWQCRPLQDITNRQSCRPRRSALRCGRCGNGHWVRKRRVRDPEAAPWVRHRDHHGSFMAPRRRDAAAQRQWVQRRCCTLVSCCMVLWRQALPVAATQCKRDHWRAKYGSGVLALGRSGGAPGGRTSRLVDTNVTTEVVSAGMRTYRSRKPRLRLTSRQTGQ